MGKRLRVKHKKQLRATAAASKAKVAPKRHKIAVERSTKAKLKNAFHAY